MIAIQQFLMGLMGHLKRKDGQALVEYALILALVAIVVIGALTFLGSSLNTTVHSIANKVAS